LERCVENPRVTGSIPVQATKQKTPTQRKGPVLDFV
jgi:hypothetical protein